MKKTMSLNLILLIGLAACSNLSDDNASGTIVPTLNLETCELIGRNGLAFSALNSGQTFYIGRNPLNENRKKRDVLGRELQTNEYTVDPKLDDELNKIEAVISQEIGETPYKRSGFFWGFIIRTWKKGISLQGQGSLDEMIPTLSFDPDKVKVIPNINSKSSLDYLSILFADQLYKDGKDIFSRGDFEGVLKINCNSSIITLYVKDEEALRLANIAAMKGGHYQGKVTPTLSSISLDLSHKLNSLNSSHKIPQLSENRKTSFATGDRVNVIFQNGSKCKATILVSGKDQSKIEYNEFCETGFISSKTKGEVEWAPNHAISAR